MNCLEEQFSICREGIELLFFSVMGIRMGIDTGEIAEILKPEDALRQGFATVALHERLQFGEAAVRYDDPHILVMKNAKERRGIIIDHPDEIDSVKIESIRPMPDIIARSGGSKAVWGAVLRDEGIIFLVDCSKMAAGEHR